VFHKNFRNDDPVFIYIPTVDMCHIFLDCDKPNRLFYLNQQT